MWLFSRALMSIERTLYAKCPRQCQVLRKTLAYGSHHYVVWAPSWAALWGPSLFSNLICKRKGLAQCWCVLECFFKVQLLGSDQTYWTRISRWETQEAGLPQTWSFYPELANLYVAWSSEVFFRSCVMNLKSHSIGEPLSNYWGPFHVLGTQSIRHSTGPQMVLFKLKLFTSEMFFLCQCLIP